MGFYFFGFKKNIFSVIEIFLFLSSGEEMAHSLDDKRFGILIVYIMAVN